MLSLELHKYSSQIATIFKFEAIVEKKTNLRKFEVIN